MILAAIGLLTAALAVWLLLGYLEPPPVRATPKPPEPPHEWIRGIYDDVR